MSIATRPVIKWNSEKVRKARDRFVRLDRGEVSEIVFTGGGWYFQGQHWDIGELASYLAYRQAVIISDDEALAPFWDGNRIY